MGECFTHRSFRYIVALLTHADNMFLTSKNVFLVSVIDSVPVTGEVLHVGGTRGEHLETPVILVTVLSVTCSWLEHYFFFFPLHVTIEDFKGWLMPFCLSKNPGF